MNVKELKEIIKDLPDDMNVGGSGHFGEFLECWDIRVSPVYVSQDSWEIKETILNICMQPPGPDPDC